MEGPQESMLEGGKDKGGKADKKRSGDVVRGLLGPARNMLLGASIFVGSTGCGGAGPEPKRVEVAGPGGGPIPMKIDRGEKDERSIPKVEDGETKREKKEETIETRRVAVIGQRHVKVDWRYYLKTKDWDKETVWVLHKGDRLPKLDTPEEISAEFRGKNMKYAGRYYSEAEDPAAWEKGVETTENGATSPRVPEKMETTKKTAEIPPEIRTLLGENAVCLRHPVVVRDARDIFMVDDSDGQRLWKFVPDRYTNLPQYGTVDRPFINGGMVYGTRATVKYGEKTEETMEQITTYDIIVAPNGRRVVVPYSIRRWLLTNDTLGQLKTRVEEDAARARVAADEKRERQREQKRQEALEQVNRLVRIVSIRGKTFTDQRGVVWTYAGGYFPSLSPGILHNTKISVENPQWGRDARGSDILIGGDQVLRWRVEGGGNVEFRAPVERKK